MAGLAIVYDACMVGAESGNEAISTMAITTIGGRIRVCASGRDRRLVNRINTIVPIVA